MAEVRVIPDFLPLPEELAFCREEVGNEKRPLLSSGRFCIR